MNVPTLISESDAVIYYCALAFEALFFLFRRVAAYDDFDLFF
jgi:hypothetical protein